MNKTESDHLLTVSAVAGILRKSTDVIKRYEKSGKLRCIKTENGMRLFRRADILQFAALASKKNLTRAMSAHRARTARLPESVIDTRNWADHNFQIVHLEMKKKS